MTGEKQFCEHKVVEKFEETDTFYQKNWNVWIWEV